MQSSNRKKRQETLHGREGDREQEMMPLHLPNKPNFSLNKRAARIMRAGAKGLKTKSPITFEGMGSHRPMAKRPSLPKIPRP